MIANFENNGVSKTMIVSALNEEKSFEDDASVLV